MSDFVYENDEQDSFGWRSDPFEGQPIDVPLGDVTGVPRSCVEIADDWVPIIISALERLKYGDMWNGDAADIRRAYQNIDTLQSLLSVGDCVGGNMDYDCINLPLFAPNVDFLPADPFDDPTEIPFGYSTPPWFIESIEDPIYGTQPGDLVVSVFGSLVAFPPVVPVSGVPRFQFTIQGPAEVDLTLVKVLQGGIALIFVDGIPRQWFDMQRFNVGDILNVNTWLETFGFLLDNFTRAASEVPVSLPNAQEYLIEVQMFPRPGLDLSLGYGGAIRKITVCSEEEQIDLSQFVTDVRTNNGNLEVELDSVWEDRGPVDLDDIQDGADLRSNDHVLEYFDLLTASWLPVPNTFFLPVASDGDVPAVTSWDLGADAYTMQAKNAGGSIVARWGTFGNRAYMWGLSGFNLLRSEGSTLASLSANRWFVRDSGTNPIDPAVFTIRGNLGETPLIVHGADGAEPFLARFKDDANNHVVEIGQNGWFSAMQQLIVNDLSSTGAKRGQGRLLGQWVDDTDPSRTARMILQVDDWAAQREAIRAEATGAAVKLGFFGSAAQIKPVVAGSDVFNVMLDLLQSLDGLGLIDNQETMSVADPYGILPVETNYEAYWDVATTQPIATDWSQTHGTWVSGEGFCEAGIATARSMTEIERVVADQAITFDWKIAFTIANLTGGTVRIRVIEETGFADIVFLDTTRSNGTYVIEVPMERHGDADGVTVRLETSDNETADICVHDLWEIGLHGPALDLMRGPDEFIVNTSVVREFNLPA